MKKIALFSLATIGIGSISNAQWTGTTTNAKVGIGTNTPTAQLSVVTNNSNSGSTPWNTALKIDDFGSGNGNLISVNSMNVVIIGGMPIPVPSQLFAVDKNQTFIYNKLRIGTTAANGSYANYKLSVDGDMIAKRCVIQVSNWADYVFNDDYEMPTLGELEKFINTNNHLPGVPSEKEVLNNGVEIGNMNKILLQKVEELTLYMIDLQKQNETLKSRIENLECNN